MPGKLIVDDTGAPTVPEEPFAYEPLRISTVLKWAAVSGLLWLGIFAGAWWLT